MDKDQFALAPIMSAKRRRAAGRSGKIEGRAFVYFIENRENGQVKIGRSSNVKKRIGQARNTKGAADGVYAVWGHVACSLENAVKIEAALHRAFAAKCVSGEWFDIGGMAILSDVLEVATRIAGSDFAVVGISHDEATEKDVCFETSVWKAKRMNGKGPRTKVY